MGGNAMTVKLTRTRYGIAFTPTGHFDARDVPCCRAGAEAVERVSREHELLKSWMEESYNSNTTSRRIVEVPFPKELLSDKKEEQETKSSKKGRLKKRVRDGSSVDAISAGDNV